MAMNPCVFHLTIDKGGIQVGVDVHLRLVLLTGNGFHQVGKVGKLAFLRYLFVESPISPNVFAIDHLVEEEREVGFHLVSTKRKQNFERGNRQIISGNLADDLLEKTGYTDSGSLRRLLLFHDASSKIIRYLTVDARDRQSKVLSEKEGNLARQSIGGHTRQSRCKSFAELA